MHLKFFPQPLEGPKRFSGKAKCSWCDCLVSVVSGVFVEHGAFKPTFTPCIGSFKTL